MLKSGTTGFNDKTLSTDAMIGLFNGDYDSSNGDTRALLKLMFGYLLPLVSPEWQISLKLKDNLTVKDLLQLRPTDEAFLLAYLQIKGEEALNPEPVEGSKISRGRKRGYASLSDNTDIFVAKRREVVQRRKSCLRVEDPELNGWYEAAFTHAMEGRRTGMDVPAESEERANFPQQQAGEDESEDHSQAYDLIDLGANGAWMEV
jgi:hypothetical protein